MENRERVEEIVASVLRVPRAEVRAERKLAELTTLDSLSLVEILSALDDAFRIRLPSESVTTVLTVGELSALVDKIARG